MVQESKIENLRKLLLNHFEYIDGELYCVKPYHKRPKGLVTGTETPAGHISISIRSRRILKHQAIFLMFHGWLPSDIDHKDRNPKNNLIDNLRAATKATNSWNRGVQKNSYTGVRGVSYSNNPNSINKWGAYIKVNGKRFWLGSYPTKELAKNAYEESYKKFVELGEIVP